MEYSIGWPVDERTLGWIGELRESDLGVALDADGDPDHEAGVAELTGPMFVAAQAVTNRLRSSFTSRRRHHRPRRLSARCRPVRPGSRHTRTGCTQMCHG